MNNAILKQTKFMISMVKEKLWLEDMALEGWFLTEMTMGCRYTFEKRLPQKLIYEVDRFNLPKNPTLKEIRQKEEFLAMAAEMGWSVIVHDEDLNYYFCKEYKDGEINELYNDFESRKFRSDKYYKRYKEAETQMTRLSLIMAIIGLIVAIANIKTSDHSGFIIFLFAYEVFCLGFCVIYAKVAEKLSKELSMATREWQELYSNHAHKVKIVYKLVFTNKKLKQFLTERSMKGWHLVNMSVLKYVFLNGEAEQYDYTMDSKHLTNLRIKKKGDDKIKDSKDWCGLNNDWQVQSLKDAENKNWRFVCALENRAILYRSQRNMQPESLNDKRYEKRFRFTSLTGQLGVWVLIGGIAGGIFGFCISYFGM